MKLPNIPSGKAQAAVRLEASRLAFCRLLVLERPTKRSTLARYHPLRRKAVYYQRNMRPKCNRWPSVTIFYKAHDRHMDRPGSSIGTASSLLKNSDAGRQKREQNGIQTSL
jgi:hypothetical protein